MAGRTGGPGSSTRNLVPQELDGERADKIVAVLGGLSRAQARELVDAGMVTTGGDPVDARQRLPAGAELDIRRLPEHRLEPEAISLEVRYEDAHLAVVEKPSGLVVHPGAGRTVGTLAAGILARWPGVEGVGHEGRWGIVHRLDREVSGLLLVALTPAAYEGLVAALAARAIDRRYRALVLGDMGAATGTIDAPVGRDPGSPTRMTVLPGGRAARTHYRRLAYWNDWDLSLLEVRLETGRTHQIRVHLASIGHPVVGDRIYGRPGPDGIDPHRVWLHAAHLEFEHPVTGEMMTLDSPLPAALRGSLDELGSPDGA